jgi:hypothetical protein
VTNQTPKVNVFDTSSLTSIRNRRIPFVITILLRLLHSAYFFSPTSYLKTLRNNHMTIPLSILSILFFFFLAWNLHLIVQMEGERKVLGRTFTRRDFDYFLWFCMGVHGSLVVAELVYRAEFLNYEVGGLVFLCVYAVAWVATWDPEDGAVRLPF